MPYIPQKNRGKFNPFILDCTKIICAIEDPKNRAKMLGYFVDNLCSGVARLSFSPNGTYINYHENKLFASIEFIDNCVGISLELHKNTDLLDLAGELNYCLSSVIWGVLGDSKLIPDARYGFRCYSKSILLRILRMISPNNETRTLTDTELTLQGVLSDVIDETYRMKTAIYEDQKIEEYGDLWPLKGE